MLKIENTNVPYSRKRDGSAQFCAVLLTYGEAVEK